MNRQFTENKTQIAQWKDADSPISKRDSFKLFHRHEISKKKKNWTIKVLISH